MYNQNYLDVVLTKNIYNHTYNAMLLFFIHGFSKFNVSHGWAKGDEVLKEFAQILDTYFDEDLVFRIFGDDFTVLSKVSIQSSGIVKVLDELMTEYGLHYTMKSVDLSKTQISKLSDLSFLKH